VTNNMTTDTPTVDDFIGRARDWLAERLDPRPVRGGDVAWGEGSDDVAIFHALEPAEESALIERARAWHQEKYAAGYAAIAEPVELGGRGLSSAHARAFKRLESKYLTPPAHEVLTVTCTLVAGALGILGSDWQRSRFLPAFNSANEICCQLFSEPGAGSDLASVTTRAVRDGDEWVLTGQKVWSSGAQDSDWGLALCRTDSSVPKHRGMTMFLVPMRDPAVEIRPIRQMNGGNSFNEVRLDGVRIGDEHRVGEVGGGWKAALTVLGFERGGGESRGGTYREVVALARWLGQTTDPLVRTRLAELYTQRQVMAVTARRAAAAAHGGGAPGPQGSIIKLLYTGHQTAIAQTVASLLGPRMIADSGEWGTFAWSQFLLGAPGNRIAGGTDETQHNIIGERVLGLPREPSVVASTNGGRPNV
jgi:alkylation response protein AidB-like acyl-CoA dehydrogenase